MPKTISLSVELRDAFKRAIAQHTGLVIREQDQDAFIKKLSIRMEALKLSCPQDYYLLLESNIKDSDREWQNLVSLITNNESYFFRDKEQLKLLQDRLLPELIQRKQADKIIRICSAGCSTGEEPYSLAIILKELLPNPQQWSLNIFGAQPSALSDRLISQLKQTTMIERAVTSDRSWHKTNPVSRLSGSQNAPLQTTGEEEFEAAENLAKQERYDAAIEQVKKVLQTDPNHFKASYLLAQIYANKGQYEEAIFYCDRALQIDSFAIAPHYLLAHIAEEKGNTGEAKRLLKQIIYLEPASVFAYLDLSHIYEKEGDKTRAVKMHGAALNILKQLSPDTQIQERENITVAELILKLETRNSE